MSKVDQYIEAATRENTRKSYRSAIEHYEVTWGGFLPATADSVARYLADNADSLALNTLRQRLAALGRWHSEQGFPDPTKSPMVKKVLKGIAEIHPRTEKRARPLQLEQLQSLVFWLEEQQREAMDGQNVPALLTHSRNKALLLLGFWRGFRSDDLCRLQVEHIDVFPDEGLEIFIPRNKTSRGERGHYFKAPALTKLCPVSAYSDWINNARLHSGPVFRSINRWGHISDDALHTDSIVPILRKLFQQAGIPEPETYSSHSLRRGFASWANANQWDVKTLMEYVGWKDVHSAMRYIDSQDPFSQKRIESGLVASIAAQPPALELVVSLRIERFHKRVRSQKKVRSLIEASCLKPHKMEYLESDRPNYRIHVDHQSDEHLEEILDDLLHQMHQIANDHQCMLEAMIKDPKTGRVWE